MESFSSRNFHLVFIGFPQADGSIYYCLAGTYLEYCGEITVLSDYFELGLVNGPVTHPPVASARTRIRNSADMVDVTEQECLDGEHPELRAAIEQLGIKRLPDIEII